MSKITIPAIVEGGKANAGPPLGPALGPLGVNIGGIIDSINKATAAFAGIKVPVKVIVDKATKTFEIEVGSPSTGELLKKAGNLLEMEIHTTVITKGYKLAKIKALEILEAMAKSISLSDDKLLVNIANTAMTGKSAERASEKLARLCVDAVKKVTETEGGKVNVDSDNIKVEKKKGGSVEDTELIEGIVIDKDVIHPAMPKEVQNAKIALLDVALEITKLETDAKIEIDTPEKMQAFLGEEERYLGAVVIGQVTKGKDH